jgi:hypothetical protein
MQKASRIILFLSILVQLSCNKDISIPSFIYIDQIKFITKGGEGTDNQNIPYAGLYLGDQLQGIYELPARIPVIASGNTQISIRGFIKRLAKEGFVIHPCFTTYDTLVNLIPEHTDSIFPALGYRTDIKFTYLEDFNAGNSLKIRFRYNNEDTMYIENNPAGSFDGSSYMLIKLKDGEGRIEIESQDEYQVPLDGRGVFMELNYICNTTFGVGFNRREAFQSYDVNIVRPYDTGGVWRKGYIELTNDLAGQIAIKGIKVLFGSANIEAMGIDPEIRIDNIKIIHRD